VPLFAFVRLGGWGTVRRVAMHGYAVGAKVALRLRGRSVEKQGEELRRAGHSPEAAFIFFACLASSRFNNGPTGSHQLIREATPLMRGSVLTNFWAPASGAANAAPLP
jgi:hypothetical protein